MPITVVLAVGLNWSLMESRRASWKTEGYSVISTASIREAIDHFSAGDFDIVLLGRAINLVDMERLIFLIRSSGSQTPVVCIEDPFGNSCSFADATLKDESDALLTGMKVLLANKAGLRGHA